MDQVHNFMHMNTTLDLFRILLQRDPTRGTRDAFASVAKINKTPEATAAAAAPNNIGRTTVYSCMCPGVLPGLTQNLKKLIRNTQ